jgi:hypothetical protein
MVNKLIKKKGAPLT